MASVPSPAQWPLTADMKHWLRNLLLLTLWIECKGQDTVTQSEPDVTASEGLSTTLHCNFGTSASFSYLFWYKQEGHNAPKYMLKKTKSTTRWGETNKSPEFKENRFDVETKENSFDLKIQELDVSDSAVYYCALRPNTGNYKLTFGTGTRLRVEPTEDYDPSVFKLEGNGTKVCLATGYSRVNKLNDTIPFNKRGNRISGDVLFNNAVVMSVTDKCEETEFEPCVATMQPDPKVNLMTLTILGLRVLFVKTVAFNVLMTLKLWLRR